MKQDTHQVLHADRAQDALFSSGSDTKVEVDLISPWILILKSWRLFLINLDVFLALMWRPFAATALAAFAAVELVPFVGVGLATLGYTLVALIVVVPVITAWHRMILLGSDNPEARATYRIGSAEWSYFKGAAALYGLGYVIGLLVEQIYGPLIGGPLLWAAREGLDVGGIIASYGQAAVHWTAVALIVGILVARFFLVLPAAAIGMPFGFSQSATATRGQGARLVLAYLLASLPAFVLAFLFDSPQTVLSGNSNSDVQFLDLVLAILPRILLYTIAVGILSLAFEQLVGVPKRVRRKLMAESSAIEAPVPPLR
ncbi:MAG: hypothetical protein P1U37_12655 [Minwuia sp.]|nr:hypothetical protein [Minwuia sp.]